MFHMSSENMALSRDFLSQNLANPSSLAWIATSEKLTGKREKYREKQEEKGDCNYPPCMYAIG